MQVTLTPATPGELRLIAKCLFDIADLSAPTHQPSDEQAQPDSEKPKARRTKQLTAKEAEAALFNIAAKDKVEGEPESAGTAPGVGESTKAPADAPASDEPTTEPVTHDTIRALFGKITDPEQRNRVVKGIKALGAAAIKDIPKDKLDEAYKLVTANA